jgi:hypothetical protein
MNEAEENRPIGRDLATDGDEAGQDSNAGRDALMAGRDIFISWVDTDRDTRDRVLELVKKELEIKTEEERSSRRRDALSFLAWVLGLAGLIVLTFTLPGSRSSVTQIEGIGIGLAAGVATPYIYERLHHLYRGRSSSKGRARSEEKRDG